ncbi:response regulator containing a CheY-like receiver domain and an HTH DNA-binding domain [Desulfitobacterium dichloroeliminans LMG P-21439]|uniref:Response regulator containing a CheY-like receiver domain and an HTH DNA-binding domain n=1 Tax=Desulfitobacterium dichloroeliminans (strain LMG P-21439 / DCA1) TaxID=871963 RepID=L0F5Z2_DESDL|nr:LuxR family transcriptional regulator [Desulfitobacterium dichloroeliminans]AGA68383.1 response regulator containing a CheY-like receiver domain and an HTH DNA-binding domain [Desulfitobacterium dichloroeliminans LMG P-21439]
MNRLKFINSRRLSIVGFSFLFAYILSFQFEGQVLYSLLNLRETDSSDYILAAIIAHFIGLFTCGLFVRSQAVAKSIMLGGMCLCLATTIPFFLSFSVLWMGGLIVSGYASGSAVAAWGYFLRVFTPKNERIKSCADVLIYSNLLMIIVNVVAMNRSPFIGLSLSTLCLVISIAFIWMLPMEKEIENEHYKTFKNKMHGGIKNPLILLCLFVFIITINSGLMYHVINPAFEHLTGLVSWYWAVPYIVALVIVRNLPMKAKRSRILYIGMAMIMGAFISFMLLGRNTTDYLIVDTLMLGACGIFDLFWWSILGEMLDYSDNPAQTFGIGLSANVFGVLCGGVLGMAVTSIGLPSAEVAVIALTVVCVTLVMLPPLNHQLVLLLKSHAYLAAYDIMSQSQQTDIVRQIKTLDPLTVREQEVLQLILSGKSNREIAGALFISESTVKTHARNIFSKYDVGSRAELISTLLKNQKVE